MARTLRLSASLFLLPTFCYPVSNESHAILEKVRVNVAEQIRRSANYACTETIERDFYQDAEPKAGVCAAGTGVSHRKIMRDRLLLNIAVLQGQEIFSWHAESAFSTEKVERLVPAGPISYGGFIGFLRNIFVSPGVGFTYLGHAKENGVSVVRFKYFVAKPVSMFRLQGANRKSVLVSFRGGFSADATTLNLVRLSISADDVPKFSPLCEAEFDVQYGMANISGRRMLIPRAYDLRVNDATALFTISRGEYSNCQEFQAESKLSFDGPEKLQEPLKGVTTLHAIPADSILQIRLQTPIDSKTSFTGDAVRGILTSALRDRDGAVIIPANAVVDGIITQLETFYQPQPFTSLRIQFSHASSAGALYRMRADHVANDRDMKTALLIYEGNVPLSLKDDLAKGALLFRTGHLKLKANSHGEWRTSSLPAGSSKPE